MSLGRDQFELTEDVSYSPLYNPDLAPTPLKKRTWNRWHIASLWIGMAVCVLTYTLASGMIASGMNWWQAILTVGLGNLIVLIPMLLNAHAGTKYGIPFPVLLRSSFGTRGANIPAMLRALVACGWFGIQTWIGGAAIFQLLAVMHVDLQTLPPILPDRVGLDTGHLVCFLFFWLVNMFFIWKGTNSIKWLETLSAPFLILAGLGLLGWAYHRAGGFGPILSQPSRFPEGETFWTVFFPSLTAMVGFWATLSLNIPDFSRFARSQKDQIIGQTLGLPPTMVLFSFIGVAVTSATVVIFGEAIWDPVVLTQRVGTPLVAVASMFVLSLATLSTNIAANVVGPANDISNLKPTLISFKMGGTITGIVGILMMPWKLVADPNGYIFTWLIGYSALLGPIAAIMIADYFIVRKQDLNLNALYQPYGPYRYSGGYNLRAIFVLILSILPNLPGFLVQIGRTPSGAICRELEPLYPYSWFVGFGVAFLLYSVMGRWTRTKTS